MKSRYMAIQNKMEYTLYPKFNLSKLKKSSILLLYFDNLKVLCNWKIYVISIICHGKYVPIYLNITAGGGGDCNSCKFYPSHSLTHMLDHSAVPDLCLPKLKSRSLRNNRFLLEMYFSLINYEFGTVFLW